MVKIRNTLIRQQDALRQEKYYEKNKEEINRRRRERYAQNKKLEIETNGSSFENIENIPNTNELIKETIENNNKVLSFDKKILPSTNDLTISKNDILLDKLNNLELNTHTKKKYVGDLKRVINLVNNEDIIPHIRNMNILKLIKEDTKYSNNTKLGLVQILLFMITQFKLKINKKAITETKKYFELLKSNINIEHNQKINDDNNSIISFSSYIDKVKTTFGEKSKMYVLTKLYYEATLRDDFILKIVDKTPKDTNENFIVNTKTNMTLIINTYKTQNRYGQIKLKLTKSLSNLIKEYMTLNNLKIGDYLFGETNLSNYVNYNNDKIGVEGGISNFRKMKISEELNKNISEEERISLAEKMKHSPLIQLAYLRKLK